MQAIARWISRGVGPGFGESNKIRCILVTYTHWKIRKVCRIAIFVAYVLHNVTILTYSGIVVSACLDAIFCLTSKQALSVLSSDLWPSNARSCFCRCLWFPVSFKFLRGGWCFEHFGSGFRRKSVHPRLIAIMTSPVLILLACSVLVEGSALVADLCKLLVTCHWTRICMSHSHCLFVQHSFQH